MNCVSCPSRPAAAQVIGKPHSAAPLETLLHALHAVVPISSVVVMRPQPGQPPQTLYENLDPSVLALFRKNLLEEIYLLGPCYQAFLDRRPAGFYTLLELGPDQFSESEVYRSYFQPAQVVDLAYFLVWESADTLLSLGAGRVAPSRPFSRSEIGRLRACFPLVSAFLRRWAEQHAASPDPACDARSTPLIDELMGSSGRSSLTARERDVVQLILRGYSSKEAARALGITPKTESIHRQHAYAKLGVRSQSDLFSRFLQAVAPHQVTALRPDSHSGLARTGA